MYFSVNSFRFLEKVSSPHFLQKWDLLRFCNPISFGMIICPPRKNSVDQRLFDPYSTLDVLKEKAALLASRERVLKTTFPHKAHLILKLFLSYRISIWIHLLSVWNMNTHCLKMTQNVPYEYLNFGNFHQFLFYLVTLFDRKLQFSKYSQNWLFLALLKNFCPLKMYELASLVMRLLGDFQTLCEWIKAL